MNAQTQWLTKTLENWLEFAKEDFYYPPGEALIVYGMGYDHWAVQTQQKAFAAAAMLAARSKDPEKIDTALSDYLASYDCDPYRSTEMFDGIDTLTAKLHSLGIRLVLLSNKQHSATVSVAQKFFPGIFDTVQGGIDGTPLKPDPIAAKNLLCKMGISPSEVAFIGDSEVDMQTAKNLGASLTIGVSWGFRSTCELLRSGADVIAYDADEIFREVTKK